MIERNLLDQTKDLRPPQRLVQSNFGMEERMAQNNRVGGMQDKTMRTLNYFPFGSFRVIWLLMRNLYIGINLNQPYCCLITLQEENFIEVVAVWVCQLIQT
jgi:hypothetical protein